MAILFYRVILDILEKMLENMNERELGRRLILEFLSIPPDYINVMGDSEYEVLLGVRRIWLDEKERQWGI